MLAGGGADDDAAFGFDVDALHVEFRGHGQALPVAFDNAEVAAGSSRELVRLVQVEPDELPGDGLGVLEYRLQVLKPLRCPRVTRHDPSIIPARPLWGRRVRMKDRRCAVRRGVQA